MVNLNLFDFFCGCGGTSKGFENAGINILGGLDFAPDAIDSYRTNFPGSEAISSDIRKLDDDALDVLLGPIASNELVFSACAPCQPFSRQSKESNHREDDRADLIWEVLRFIRRHAPKYLFFENVPGLIKLDSSLGSFALFKTELLDLGYQLSISELDARDYGIPQRRRRLVMLGSLNGSVKFPTPTHGPQTDNRVYSSVSDWIAHLPALGAGQSDENDPIHQSMRLSDLNLKRIRATPEGGGRSSWPSELLVQCHTGGFKGHTDTYGRLSWDKPSPGLTTRCNSYSNGRFGHPSQDRALSIREAACIQTFPDDYKFVGKATSMAKQIGNAVPVKLAEHFAEQFVNHAVTGDDPKAPQTVSS